MFNVKVLVFGQFQVTSTSKAILSTIGSVKLFGPSYFDP